MKKIIALAVTSLIASGVYAQGANTKAVTKPTEAPAITTVTAPVDDNSRLAIFEALGTNETEVKTVQANEEAAPKEKAGKKADLKAQPKVETKVVAKTEATEIKTEGKPAIVVTRITPVEDSKAAKPVTTTEVKTENRPVVVVTQTKTEPTKTETKVENKAVAKTDASAVAKPIQVTTKTETKTETKTTTVTPVVAAKDTKVVAPVPTEIKPVAAAPKAVEVKEVKKVVKKAVKKKTVAKKAPKKDGIDLVKSPTSISEAPYEAIPVPSAGLLYSNQVQATLIPKNDASFTVALTDLNGKNISSDNFKNIRDGAQLVGYWVSNDLKDIQVTPITVYGQTSEYNFAPTKEAACKTLFVQYQLKTSSDIATLTGYVDYSGKFSSSRDPKCVGPVANSHDNISHSKQNNIVGIFMADLSNTSKKPLRYSIINNRNGRSYTPANLESFVISRDYTKFYSVKPEENTGTGIKGNKFAKSVRAGSYYVVGQFPQDNIMQTVITSVEVQ